MATEPVWVGKTVFLEDVREVALGRRKVALTPTARGKIKKGREFLEKEIRRGEALYGVNTGFGELANVRVPDEDIDRLQLNLIRSHSVGVGEPLDAKWVRAMMFLRAASLSAGHSGVRIEVVNQLIELINRGVVPYIPSQGSVGASGDLAPLAHLALVLVGEGKAWFKGALMPGGDALAKAGLRPIELKAKEGLALINGTQLMASFGAILVLEAERLANLADLIGAMSCEAFFGTAVAFHPSIHRVRNQKGQQVSANRLLSFTQPKGKKSAMARSHEGCERVQDPYSFRCMPQVHGASRDWIASVREVVQREVNAVTDNPLLFPQEGLILSGGNFHGQPIAMALDVLSIAVAELGSISEMRLDKLTTHHFSDLPPFLAPDGGLNSGFMIVQYAAAALVSENKTLAHPACVDTIPTSAGKEDHVSMGAWGARKAAMVVSNVTKVLAMEALGAAQAIDLRRPLKSSTPVEQFHRELRKLSPAMMSDRSLHEDMTLVEQSIRDGRFDRFSTGET